MPRYRELDTLRSFTAKLNTALSAIQVTRQFADLLVENHLLGDTTARNIVSPTGIDDYSKVSRLMSAVYSHVQTVASPARATSIFNTLVVILYRDLHLKDLAEQLVKHRGEGDPSYEKPLLSAVDTEAAPGPSVSTTAVSSSGDILKTKPTLKQLSLLKSETMKVEIIKSVAPLWKKVAILMDFDETGAQISIFEDQYAGRSSENPCRAVFQHWLQGNGIKVTWETLIELLKDIEMGNLADDLENILKTS